MIGWHNLLIERPSYPVPSIHHQTLLSKTIFEQCLDYAQVASIALASKSIQNSSLSPNFASKIIIDEKSVLFETVFHPSTSLPLQFVPELRLNGFVQLLQDLVSTTKYFTKSLRTLTLTAFPMSQFVSIAEEGSFFTGLAKLDIMCCTMCDADAAFINSPIHFPRLQIVNLWVLDSPPSKMSNMKLKSLWCLNFSGGNSMFHELTSEASALQKLTINASRSEISDEGLSNFHRFQEHLTTLELTGAERVTWNGLKHLASLTNLTSLNLRGLLAKSDEIDWEILFSSLPQLKSLDLSFCNVNEETFRQISQMRRIRSLHLVGAKLSFNNSDVRCADALIEKYLTLVSATLTDLNLKKWVALSPSGLSCLAALTNLTNLNLAFCSELNDDALQQFGERMPRLKKLEIENCKEVTFVPKINPSTFLSLETIGVGWLQVTDSMLTTFPASFPHLKTLDLSALFSNSRISDIGLEHISRLLLLESLNLEKCDSITNQGLTLVFCRLLRLKNLNISRSGGGVTDEVFKQCLDDIRRRLCRLEINFSRSVTMESVRLLQSTCPHLALRSLGIGEKPLFPATVEE